VITEPMTLITDWILAALCVVLGARLARRSRESGSRSSQLLAWAFYSTALGAFVGGAAHGFRPYLGDVGLMATWKLTVWSIGATAFLFVASAATAALSSTPRRALVAVAATQAAVYSLWMMTHDDFFWVIADYVPAMLVVLLLQILQWRRGEPSAGWIAAGIATSFLGAGIQASGLAPHRHFNHNDLYHVVQMAATWMLYRGGMLLRDDERSRMQ
jgi:hypothetical protein